MAKRPSWGRIVCIRALTICATACWIAVPADEGSAGHSLGMRIDPLLVRMTSRLAALRRKVDAGWVDSLVPSLNLSWTLSSAARIWRAADVGASSNRPNSKTSWRSMSTNERNSPLSPLLGLADADVTVP
ncbi:MAG: hypothetical protein R2856_32630 [Caldilineaceae bacterium]